MSTWGLRLMIPIAAVAMASPATAQFSEGSKLIKAIKEKDGATATKILSTPGTTLVNIRDGETGDAGLHIVVKRRDSEWLGFLLQRDADPNVRDRDGATPLMVAAANGFEDGVRILTAIKARVDLANRLGETALLKAVQARNPTIVRMLLDAGASPDTSDNSGNSPRSVAIADPRGGPVARLLKDAPARKSAPTQGPVL